MPGGVDGGITYHQDAEGAQQTAAEVREQGADAVIKRLDLDDLPTAAAAIDVLADELGGVDVLVNNAGTGTGGKAIDLGALTQVLAVELAEYAITVNSVAPGEISTPMTGQTDVDPREQERPGVPLGRTGHAREIASVIAFLATPAASYFTGASLIVDGGMTLMGPQASQLLTDHDWRNG